MSAPPILADRIRVSINARRLGFVAVHRCLNGRDAYVVTDVKSGLIIFPEAMAISLSFDEAMHFAAAIEAALTPDEWGRLTPEAPPAERRAIGAKWKAAIEAAASELWP